MIRELRQSTTVVHKTGPFVDATDGSTEETALTITQSDVLVSKNGGAFAQKNESSSSPHDISGYYDVSYDDTDTNTLGSLVVKIHMAGCLPVWEYFMVVAQAYWDWKYANAELHTVISGTGTIEVPYYMFENEEAETTPIANCYVWVTNDEDGRNIVASGYTDNFGLVTFWLDEGTYYMWRSKSGYTFSNPDTEIVVAEGEAGEPGTGPISWDYYMFEDEEEETGPILGVYVRVTSDITGLVTVASGYTDNYGKVSFNLNAGTYYLWRSKVGWTFVDPDIETVS